MVLCQPRLSSLELSLTPRAQDEELTCVWQLLCALWRRDYEGISAALRSSAFSAAVQPAVAACAAAHRRSTLELLSVSYSTLSLSDTATALAMSEREALAAVTALGWTTLEGLGAWLAVAPSATVPVGGGDPAALLHALVEQTAA
jgi:hypothetical protein